jgi:hypothetical protein
VTINEGTKANLLAAVAALAASFVRNIVQYHRYSWGSTIDFLGAWFLHFMLILLCAAITCAIVKSDNAGRFGTSENLRRIEFEDAIIFASGFVIVASALLFLGAHSYSDDE